MVSKPIRYSSNLLEHMTIEELLKQQYTPLLYNERNAFILRNNAERLVTFFQNETDKLNLLTRYAIDLKIRLPKGIRITQTNLNEFIEDLDNPMDEWRHLYLVLTSLDQLTQKLRFEDLKRLVHETRIPIEIPLTPGQIVRFVEEPDLLLLGFQQIINAIKGDPTKLRCLRGLVDQKFPNTFPSIDRIISEKNPWTIGGPLPQSYRMRQVDPSNDGNGFNYVRKLNLSDSQSIETIPPIEKAIDEAIIRKVLVSCDDSVVNNTDVRIYLLENELRLRKNDACLIYPKIKLQKPLGAYKVELAWLPEGRRVCLLYDIHDSKGKLCSNRTVLGDQLMQFFRDHPYTDFDLISDISLHKNMISYKGPMLEFDAEYRDSFGTKTFKHYQRGVEDCPHNVYYHHADIRLLLNITGKEPRPDFCSQFTNHYYTLCMSEKWGLGYTESMLYDSFMRYMDEDPYKGNNTIDDFRDYLVHYMNDMKQRTEPLFVRFYGNLSKMKQEDRISLIDTIAERLSTVEEHNYIIDVPIFMMDMYTIARFEREYDREENGPSSSYVRNGIFWFGGWHCETYSMYLRKRYPEVKFMTFNNLDENERCIDLGKYNLDDFFMRRVSPTN